MVVVEVLVLPSSPATLKGAAPATPKPLALARDVGGLRADTGDPCLHGLGNEFLPIVRTNMCRWSTQDERVRQYVDDVIGIEAPRHPNGQQPRPFRHGDNSFI